MSAALRVIVGASVGVLVKVALGEGVNEGVQVGGRVERCAGSVASLEVGAGVGLLAISASPQAHNKTAIKLVTAVKIDLNGELGTFAQPPLCPLDQALNVVTEAVENQDSDTQ